MTSAEVERYEPVLEGEVLTKCMAAEASCHCNRAPHAGGLHECECGGSWEYVDGEFVPRSMPRLGGSLGSFFAGFGLSLSWGDDRDDDDDDAEPAAWRPPPYRAPLQIGFAGPRECHVTAGGIRVHVKPGCRCPRARR
jgi:hypothetical protein